MNTEELTKERGEEYGSWDTNSDISQTMKKALRSGPGWEKMTNAQREALEMMCTKMSRLANGNPNHADSWRDIPGYTHITLETMKKAEVIRREHIDIVRQKKDEARDRQSAMANEGLIASELGR